MADVKDESQGSVKAGSRSRPSCMTCSPRHKENQYYIALVIYTHFLIVMFVIHNFALMIAHYYVSNIQNLWYKDNAHYYVSNIHNLSYKEAYDQIIVSLKMILCMTIGREYFSA